MSQCLLNQTKDLKYIFCDIIIIKWIDLKLVKLF